MRRLILSQFIGLAFVSVMFFFFAHRADAHCGSGHFKSYACINPSYPSYNSITLNGNSAYSGGPCEPDPGFVINFLANVGPCFEQGVLFAYVILYNENALVVYQRVSDTVQPFSITDILPNTPNNGPLLGYNRLSIGVGYTLGSMDLESIDFQVLAPPPMVDAGPDQIITLPSSALLDGTVTYYNTYSQSAYSGYSESTYGYAESTYGYAEGTYAGPYEQSSYYGEGAYGDPGPVAD